MYKQASQLKLKFATTVGLLTVEQLWGLSLDQLSSAIKIIKKGLKDSDKDDDLAFLDDEKTVDVENQLRFNILKDVYVTKKNEINSIRDAANIKAHNAKIDTLIAEKRDGELKNMSISDLEKLRK